MRRVGDDVGSIALVIELELPRPGNVVGAASQCRSGAVEVGELVCRVKLSATTYGDRAAVSEDIRVGEGEAVHGEGALGAIVGEGGQGVGAVGSVENFRSCPGQSDGSIIGDEPSACREFQRASDHVSAACERAAAVIRERAVLNV